MEYQSCQLPELITVFSLHRDFEIMHQRDMKDVQNNHSMERSTLEQRDLHNSQEIEALHRKCRCLTKL